MSRDDIVKKLLDESIDSFIVHVHSYFRNIESFFGDAVACSLTTKMLVYSTAYQLKAQLMLVGILKDHGSDSFVDDVVGKLNKIFNDLIKKYDHSSTDRKIDQNVENIVYSLINHDSFDRFFRSCLKTIYNVQVAYGDLVSYVLMTNLFMSAMVYQWRSHAIFEGILKDDDSDSFVDEACELVNRLFDEIEETYSRGGNGKV